MGVAIFLTEAVALGAGYASTLAPAGDEAVGAVYAASGLITLALPLLVRSDPQPEFLFPYGAGLMALAYYNARYGDTDSDSRKLWTNVLGFNAVVAVAVASSLVFSGRRSAPEPLSRASVHVSPHGLTLAYRMSW